MDVIKSFKNKETEQVYKRQFVKRLGRDVQKLALRKLQMLNAAGDLRDLLIPPGNRLEALKHDRLGQYSIRINDQFRVCFKWEGGATDVEIVDYH